MESLFNTSFIQGFGAGLFFWSILVWSLIWKGMALWKAAKLDSRNWFIAILIINTFGILDILYIYVFSKKKGK